MKIIYFITAFSILILYSCNNVQSQIDNVESKVEHAEQNMKDMTDKDWINLESKIVELETNLESHKNDYNEAQIKEIGKIQGKYAILIVKKGLVDFQKSVSDLGNQLEGFKEGIK